MYTVKFQRKDSDKESVVTFDNINDARLWWDTVAYLHSVYYLPISYRP